jgi:hypothetical protein
MSRCRVASRVVSIMPALIACIQGEGAPTNAAKVSRSSSLLFRLGGGRPGRRTRSSDRCPMAVVRSLPGRWLSAALRLPEGIGVGRRVASTRTPAPTPSLHSAIAANGGEW